MGNFKHLVGLGKVLHIANSYLKFKNASTLCLHIYSNSIYMISCRAKLMLLSTLIKFWSVGILVLKMETIRALLFWLPVKKKGLSRVALNSSRLLVIPFLMPPYRRTFLVTIHFVIDVQIESFLLYYLQELIKSFANLCYVKVLERKILRACMFVSCHFSC